MHYDIGNQIKEEEKCTFRPKISKGSKMISSRPKTSKNINQKYKTNDSTKPQSSIFDKLYEDGKSKLKKPVQKTRKEIEDEKDYAECTFQPNLK